MHSWSAMTPTARREAAAKIAGVGKVFVATSAALEHQLAEAVAPIAARLMDSHDAFLAPATTTGKNIAPRVAALARRHADQRHPLGRGRRHLHPPDLCRQRDRDREVEGLEEGHHRPHDRVRERGCRRRLGLCRAGRSRRRRGQEQLRRPKPRRANDPNSPAPRSSSPAAAPSARRNNSMPCSTRSPTSSARASARAAPRSTPATRPTIIRSARPARSSLPKSISRSAFPARSSTSPA